MNLMNLNFKIACKKALLKSVHWIAVFCLLTFSLVSCEQPSMVNADTGKADGEKIYKYYCTSCHGPKGGRNVGKAADLRKSVLNDDEIRQMIMFGSDKGMVAYQSMINDEELDALVEHVKSLRN